MKRGEVRRRVLDGYNLLIGRLTGGGPGKRLHGYDQAVAHRSKFVSCGRFLRSNFGQEVQHWCRRPVCPTCSTFWGRKIANSLVGSVPNSTKNDYMMASLVFGVFSDPDGAFDEFRSVRRTIANAVEYRRRRAGPDRAAWRAFGAAGALEIDVFSAETFALLGSHKRQQYRDLGFDATTATGTQWVATAHLLIHGGTLGEGEVEAFLRTVAAVVHLQDLRAEQSLHEAAEAVGGYGAKVRVETALAGGKSTAWSQADIADYIAASMRCSHGRQGFKLLIRPRQERLLARLPARRPLELHDREELEPMPIAF